MSDDFFGQVGNSDVTSEENLMRLAVRQGLSETRIAVPVVVKTVHGGGVGAPPTVDVQVLIKQMDGQGNTSSHGVIFGIPVMRIQGGKAAIIADPVAGDVGWMLCADRDISAFKANQGKESQPGSFRRFDLADGVYLGAILNPANQEDYVQFTTKGVKVVGKGGNQVILDSDTGLELDDSNGNKIQMTSSGINLNGVIIDSSGNIKTPGGVTAGFGTGDSVTLQHHTHTGNNIPPTPGT